MKKLIVASSTFREALQIAKMGMRKKSVLPILECFKCEVRIADGKTSLEITGTDLENFFTATIHCEAKEQFGFTLPSNDLGFIESIEEQPLTLEIDTEKNTVAIHTETESVMSVGEAVEDYPITPSLTIKKLGNLSTDFITELKTSIKYVCTDTRFGKLQYQGVGIETTEQGLNLIATDAWVLRQSCVKGEMENVGTSFVMNPTVCKLISRLKKVEDLQLSLMEGESSTNTVLNFYAKRIQATVIARNFDCNVVDYKAATPTYSTTTVTINKRSLQQKVEQAMLYANHNFQGVFSINGKVILTAQDMDNTKEFKSEFAHERKEGEDLDISFNLSFLKKVLANMSSDTVTIEMTTQSRAAVIREDSVLTLVMPILLAA